MEEYNYVGDILSRISKFIPNLRNVKISLSLKGLKLMIFYKQLIIQILCIVTLCGVRVLKHFLVN